MLEFTKYPPETPMEERKGEPVCVVTYPNPCGRAAVGEVWGLPFCEAHGEEAHAAARLEAHEDAQRELHALLGNVDDADPVRNPLLREALASVAVPGAHPGHDHGEAIRAAYDLDAATTDPDTLAYDYSEDVAGDTPFDWWSEAREMLVGWMREAHEACQPSLLAVLEPLRERATVQEALAGRDMERRYVEPRRALREERRKRDAEREAASEPAAEILEAANGSLGCVLERLEELPAEGSFDREAIRKARGAIAEAGEIVAKEERRVFVATERRRREARERPGDAA